MALRQQFHQLAQKGDIQTIKNLLDAHPDLIQEEMRSPIQKTLSFLEANILLIKESVIYWASQAPNADELVGYLIENGLNLKKITFKLYNDYPPFSLLGMFVVSTNRGNSVAFALLPLYRMALRYEDPSIANPFNNTMLNELINFGHQGSQAEKILLCEGLIRGNAEIIKKLQDYVGDVSLEDIKEQVGNRKFNSQIILNARNKLSELVQQNKMSQSLCGSILNLLEKHQDYSIELEHYPECLQSYLKAEKKQQLGGLSLEGLVARLQYARNQVPSPYTLEQLKQHHDRNAELHIKFIAENLTLYTVDVLRNFINPLISMQSLVEITLRNDIETIICETAINDHFTQEERNQCVILLFRYENPNEFEQAVMVSAKVSFAARNEMEKKVMQLENSLKQKDHAIAALQE